MTGVICPKCRRANPEGALFCEFCQTALNRPGSTGAPPPSSPEEEPEWLRRVRERKQQDATRPRTSGEQVDSNLDAVLRRIGAARDPLAADEESPAKPGETPRQGELLPRKDVSSEKPADGVKNPPPAVAGIPADEIDQPTETFSADLPIDIGASLADETAAAALMDATDNSTDAPTASRPEATDAAAPDEPAEPTPAPYTPLMPGLEEIQGTLPGEEIDYTEPAPRPAESTLRPERVSFEATLRAERQSTTLPTYHRSKTSFIARWLITALLLGFISFAILGGTAPRSLPVNIPLETASLYESVRGIPPAANILLVIAYQPAYSGEVETAAGEVIHLLADKQAKFQVVSTTSQNLFLAEKLLAAVQRYYPTRLAGYHAGSGYDILGYLPGGPAGLRGLLADLPASLPVSLNLASTAAYFQAAGIQNLNDYDGILLLTDDPEAARLWVEQVSPDLIETRLWLAVSSQAVPLVRPYYRSGQVDGLVGGLYGAVCLEQVLRQTGPATRLWNGYENGLLIALFAVLIGAILNFTGFTLIRHKKEGAR